jgi:hypothetical protein
MRWQPSRYIDLAIAGQASNQLFAENLWVNPPRSAAIVCQISSRSPKRLCRMHLVMSGNRFNEFSATANATSHTRISSTGRQLKPIQLTKLRQKTQVVIKEHKSANAITYHS